MAESRPRPRPYWLQSPCAWQPSSEAYRERNGLVWEGGEHSREEATHVAAAQMHERAGVRVTCEAWNPNSVKVILRHCKDTGHCAAVAVWRAAGWRARGNTVSLPWPSARLASMSVCCWGLARCCSVVLATAGRRGQCIAQGSPLHPWLSFSKDLWSYPYNFTDREAGFIFSFSWRTGDFISEEIFAKEWQ